MPVKHQALPLLSHCFQQGARLPFSFIMSRLHSLFSGRLSHHPRLQLFSKIAAACAVLSACGGGTADTATATTAPTNEVSPTDTLAEAARYRRPVTTTPTTTAPPSTTTPTTLPVRVSTSVNFTSTASDFPNPDRGFYAWGGSNFITAFDLGSVQGAYASGMRLALASVPLDNYRTSDLPASFLSTLSARFAAVRAAGMKVTLLFAYDFTSNGNDASAAQIKRHLEQLRPILAANADVIPYMRAGFIGAWGEWHSSKSGNSCGYNAGSTPCTTADANRAIVRDALLANVPATTQIGFRYPSDLQRWYPLADGPARVGAHNDCFLAGPTDTGTYTASSQRPYVQKLSQRTAFGGETCENAEAPLRNTCADILSEGALYHLAWLNSTYAPSVMASWKSGGCYNQVSRSMGYRLQLDALTHDTTATRGGSTTFAVDLRNVGWARMFSPRKLVITLRHKTTGATLTGAAGDLSTLASQASASTRISVTVPIPAGAQTGDYEVRLSAPDIFASTAGDARFAVRFANADNPGAAQFWDATTAAFKVGNSVTIN
jgi:Domain of unknown function (DUF4832)/Domain of unknown function (DUF4874)